jgi:hypothetical protein
MSRLLAAATTVVLLAGALGVTGASLTAQAAPKAPLQVDRAAAEDFGSILGTPQVGETLTAVIGGDWVPFPVAGFSYQWMRGATAISNATASTYVVTASDLGTFIAVRITSRSSPGQPAQSRTVTLATAIAPDTFDAAPTYGISGVPKVGGTVKLSSSGAWTPEATRTYRWQSSGDDGVTWANISMATSSSYQISSAYSGDLLRVAVKGTRAGYASLVVPSSEVRVLPGAIPLAVEITGSPGVGSVVSAAVSDGGLGAATTFAWKLDGVAIPAATSADYLVRAGDLGGKLSVTVTAVLAGLPSVSKTSAGVTVTPGAGPTDAVDAIDDGTPRVDEPLRVLSLTPWSDLPVAYTYQWVTVFAGSGTTVAISGATTSRYVPRASDVDRSIRLNLTAHFASGLTETRAITTSDTVWFAGFTGMPTVKVGGLVSGVAKTGATLSAVTTGTFTPTATMRYRWQRLESNGEYEFWSTISYPDTATTSGWTATSSTYRPTSKDQAYVLRVIVIGGRPGYGGYKESYPDEFTAASDPFLVFPPSNPVEALIDGGPLHPAHPGLVVEGYGFGTEGATFTYQWYLDGSAVAGEKGATYTVRHSDVGRKLTLKVTSKKSGWPTSTHISPPIIPTYDSAPSGVDSLGAGPPVVGNVLELEDVGPWEANTPAGYAFQWQRSNDGATWTSISGATGPRFAITASDLGRSLRLKLTARFDFTPSVTRFVVASGVVQPATFATTPDYAVSGTPRVGATIKAAATGSWSPSATVAYRWQHSADDGATWANISKATSSSYQISSAYQGHQLRLVVRGSRSGYSTVEITTPATTKVAAQRVPVPVVTGASSILRVGVPVSVTAPAPPDGTTARWQWYTVSSVGTRTAIPDAYQASFTPTAAEKGRKLAVQLRWERPGYAIASAYSATSTYAVGLGTITVSAPGELSGIAASGEVLTLAPPTVDTPDAAISYQWTVDGKATSEVGTTFTLGAAHVGKTVAVVVTVAVPGYATSTSKLSAGIIQP